MSLEKMIRKIQKQSRYYDYAQILTKELQKANSINPEQRFLDSYGISKKLFIYVRALTELKRQEPSFSTRDLKVLIDMHPFKFDYYSGVMKSVDPLLELIDIHGEKIVYNSYRKKKIITPTKNTKRAYSTEDAELIKD